MKTFEFSFDDSLKSKSFEERINILREIGKNAAADFSEKYADVEKWFTEYDPMLLLSFCMYYFAMTPEGYDEEAEKGSLEFPPHYLEILQAIALSRPRHYSAKPMSHDVPKFKKSMKEVGNLAIQRMFNIPENLNSEADVRAYELRTQMMGHTLAIRNWAYYHQMQQVSEDLAGLIKDEFRLAHQGIDPVTIIRLFETMVDKVTDRVNHHRNSLAKIFSKPNYQHILTEYENVFPQIGKSSDAEKKKLWEDISRNKKNLLAMLCAHSDLFLEQLFTFSVQDITSLTNNELSSEQVRYLFDRLSFQLNDLKDFNKEHILLGNPIHDKPFIKVEPDQYFTSIWIILPHLTIGLLESFIDGSDKLKARYTQIRGKYLEDELKDLFKKSFPSASIFSGSIWKDNKTGKDFENDLLVIVGPFAIIVEAKSGGVTNPAKRGAPERLFKTIKELIEEPSTQALRFIEYLKANQGQLIFKTRGSQKNQVNTTGIKYFIPIGITLSHLGSIGTNLKLLIDAQITDKKIYELASSISLTDLQIVFDILTTEAQKIHYLQRRRELETSMIYYGDELDLLGFYLDTGFNIGKNEGSNEYSFSLTLKSKELDPYIIGSAQGKSVPKPELRLTKWWKEILEFVGSRKPQNWLETSYIMMNLHKDEQEQFENLFSQLIEKMAKKQLDKRHNWIVYESANENRKFVVAGYPYTNEMKKERNAIMEDIISEEYSKHVKGILVIGVNLDKQLYPYGAIASMHSPELFDSQFSNMINVSGNSKDN